MSTESELPFKLTGIVQRIDKITDFQTGIEKMHVTTEYYQQRMIHIKDGPASTFNNPDNGYLFHEWFRNGERITEQEFQQWLDKKNLNEKLHSTLKPKPTEKRSKL